MFGWSLFISTVFLLITPAVFGASSQINLHGISPELVLSLSVLAYAAYLVASIARKLQNKTKDNALCR